MRLELEINSLEATAELGAALAALVVAGDVLALEGDLGAGKTTLVRAIATSRGVDPGMVSSPTFVIANEYPTPDGPCLVHVDAYRLTSPDDLDAVGWDQLADGSALLLVEWPERIAGALPPDRTARLTLRVTGETSRRVSIAAPAGWASREGLDRLRSLAGAPREPTTCPVTGRPVPADAPTWPFADEQARMADLYRWFSGQYQMSRPVEQSDIEEED